MRRIETSLPEVFLIEPAMFGDEASFSLESYHAEKFAALGVETRFVQDNHSHSERGVLRGLHYQLQYPQAKLCRVVQGAVLDVVVDIRRGSPRFGQWTSAILSKANNRQIYVPRGFAHGFLVVSQSADFLYQCDEFYHLEDEHGIAWNDPRIEIDWALQSHGIKEPTLSKKDSHNRLLSDLSDQSLPLYTTSH
jgi:dTDP-4-dehydrorhamnose 3,5-epimerase